MESKTAILQAIIKGISPRRFPILADREREGNAAIYEQKWTGCAEPSPAYEVIRIRRRDAFQVGGRFVEAAEVYPNSEAWGADGFTFTDKDAAFVKLRDLA